MDNTNFDVVIFLWDIAAKSAFLFSLTLSIFSAAQLRALHGERKLRVRPAARVHVQGGIRADQRRCRHCGHRWVGKFNVT